VASSTLSTNVTRGNTITGGLLVLGGTLELNKTNTGGTNLASNANVSVGDAVGGANADRLVILQSNQILDARTITVQASGQLEFAQGTTDTVTNDIVLFAGSTAEGSANLNFAGTGATLTNNITVSYRPGTLASNGATITGNLITAAPRTFTVNDGPAVHDLKIDAIVGGTAGGIAEAGAGRLTLTQANTFGGAVLINAGILRHPARGRPGRHRRNYRAPRSQPAGCWRSTSRAPILSTTRPSA